MKEGCRFSGESCLGLPGDDAAATGCAVCVWGKGMRGRSEWAVLVVVRMAWLCICGFAPDALGMAKRRRRRAPLDRLLVLLSRFPLGLSALLSNLCHNDKEEDVETLFLVPWFVDRTPSLSPLGHTQVQHKAHRHTGSIIRHPLQHCCLFALIHTHPTFPPHSGPRLACSRRPYVDLLLLLFVVVDHRSSFSPLSSASQAFIPHHTSSPCICWAAGTCMSCPPREHIPKALHPSALHAALLFEYRRAYPL